MKMVKSAFLTSAAGLVAMSGAQAADLPVKAKPVEYVKVCSLYGAGFYYIPGTDICMKIGNYIRFQQGWGDVASIAAGPFGGNNGYNRENNSYTSRVRAISTFDTRQQTAYGTLRTYLLIGFTNDSTDGWANSLYTTRAFIQIAGFTFGKASSFYDFAATAAVAYNAGHQYSSDTGDAGQIVAAYTHQFGNGVSATIAAEQDKRRGVDYLGATVTGGGAGAVAANLGADLMGAAVGQVFVGNLRIDQAWGSAQVAGVVRNASASYYGSGPGGNTLVEWNNHPGDEWGWGISGGLRLNAPMFGPGDYFQTQINYTEGAIRWASNSPGSALISQGQSIGQTIHNDGGFTGTAAVPGIFELTTAWSIFASYEHFWTPSLRTSVYGSYLNISRPDALNNAMCASALYNASSAGQTRATGCDLDTSAWNIGTRSQWNITKDLYVGLDVIYHKLDTARFNAAGTATMPAGIPGKVAGAFYTVSDQDAVVATWRIHRDIVP